MSLKKPTHSLLYLFGYIPWVHVFGYQHWVICAIFLPNHLSLWDLTMMPHTHIQRVLGITPLPRFHPPPFSEDIKQCKSLLVFVNSGFKCCWWNMILSVINCFMQWLFPLTEVIQTPHYLGFIFAPFLHIQSGIHSLRLGFVSLASILLDHTVYFSPFQEIIFDSKYQWKIYYLEKSTISPR